MALKTVPNGKGDKERNLSSKFKQNYDKINWVNLSMDPDHSRENTGWKNGKVVYKY